MHPSNTFISAAPTPCRGLPALTEEESTLTEEEEADGVLERNRVLNTFNVFAGDLRTPKYFQPPLANGSDVSHISEGLKSLVFSVPVIQRV